ncbi:MAG: NAD-dependent epimerase/dehydratase family protein, partial [Bdellovibrionia bacterium]
MKIAITGAAGLLGWHLRCLLKTRPDVQFVSADRATFGSEKLLNQFVSSCDVLVHYAGMNRGPDQEIYDNNVGLARSLVGALEKTGATPLLVFSSSTHVARDTFYGRSKRESAEIFTAWSQKTGGHFLNLILPHVFGEGGRPYYNSVMSTFCHQLANAEEPVIQNNAELELLHAGDVAKVVLQAAGAPVSETRTVPGYKITVVDLLARLREIKT